MRRHRRSVYLLVVLTSTLSLAGGVAKAGATPSFTEPSFQSVPLATGLDLPTNVAWAPDGRMFIAEKEGYVRVVEANGTLLPDPIVDIHDHVIPYGDRGIIGIAVAPVEKSTDLRLYLLYDRGNPEGASDETVATATLTSVTVHANNTVVGPKGAINPTETTILGSINSPGATYGSACASESLDCIPSDGFTHSIGTVLVDPKDDSLWIGSGDGLNDFGDEANPVETRSLHIRAQNPESLAGKILHVKADGSGFANSPFCTIPADTTSNCSKVYALGFRNPFRFTLRQHEGETVPVIGDVGEGHWEEIDLPTSRGFNGGWPCYEGNEANPDFTSTTRCKEPTTPFDAPLFVYTHFNDQCSYPGKPEPPEPCNTNNDPGAAIASTGVYTGKTYPASYEGKLFVADYVNGWLSAVEESNPPPYGYSSGIGMPLFATELGELVDTVQAPDGDLVYVTLSVNSETALGLGTVQEIRYEPADKAPVAEPVAASSCVDSSTSPREIDFIGDDSYDPDGDTALSYHWDFGDGSPPSSEANPVHTYAKDGNYVARLTVTDSKENSASGFLAVHVHSGQTGQPEADIKFPEPTREYLADTNLELSGDNKTAGASSQWQIVRYEGTEILSAEPPVETGTEGSTSFHTDRSPSSSLGYMLHFVSSNGTCTTTVSRRIEPQRGELTLAAQDEGGKPLAAPLKFGEGAASPAPLALTVVKNSLTEVSAPETFSVGASTYRFQHWSDGGAAEHQVRLFEYPTHVADEAETLTVTYALVPPSGGGGGAGGSGGGSSPPLGGGLPNPGESLGKTQPPAAPTISLDRVKRHRPSALSGTATSPLGVRSVRVAIRPARVHGHGCEWWSPRRRGFARTHKSCSSVQWLKARLHAIAGGARWSVALAATLPKGRYLLRVQAVDAGGRTATTFQNDRSGLLVVH